MANIDIEKFEPGFDNERTYSVFFYDDNIYTTVTHDPNVVTDWISKIESIHRHRLYHLVVGLDIEWRPNNRYYTNPVATLQLCVGRRCLIYQLIHSSGTPISLVNFLSNQNYTFVGVGIRSDLEKLEEDYGFGGDTNAVDLRGLAAVAYGRGDLKNAGLKTLVSVVMGKDMEKPERVTRSRWDYRRLMIDQVKYACVDAFVSFEIGRILKASTYFN